jgi:hypothetical protein
VELSCKKSSVQLEQKATENQLAKRIAIKVIDHQIASEVKWKAAETRYQRGLFLRR